MTKPLNNARKPIAVVDPLAAALEESGPMDVFLRHWFRANPNLGRQERGVLAELIFDVMRHRRLYETLVQGDPGALKTFGRAGCLRALSHLRRRLTPTGDAKLQQWAASRMTLVPHLQMAQRLSLPNPWWEALITQLGEAETIALGERLLEPAPLDVRINTLKAQPEQVIQMLEKKNMAFEALADLPTGLRLHGKPALEKTMLFEHGWIEVQDAGSQRLVQFAGPKRGQTVVDFCAGAGGKTLAMAAMMRSSGQIFACDVSGPRLRRMAPRLARSGASNVQPFQIDSERDPKLKRLQGRADLVLVDAPCSGSGTVRRNPEIKWRIGTEDLARLAQTQLRILQEAARLVKPGGSLVYATCSLFLQENEGVADRFEAASGEGFEREASMRLWPHRDGTDGFFAVRWKRTLKLA
jgi:16S rRNA (cytosine967-C5)-methyltransferase